MYRIAICEDDPVQRMYEEMLVRNWAGDRKYHVVLDGYSNSEHFLFECEDKPSYDLLILDIKLGGMDGMELAAKLRERGQDAAIIFLTGIPDYAVEGYAVGAVRYLLKPVREADFLALLDMLYKNCEKGAGAYFVLEQGGSTCKIRLDEILYIKARGHYIYMKTASGGRDWKGSFSLITPVLENKGFFLLKRGLIVNLAHVGHISRTECTLDDGGVLPVARSKYKELNEAFIAYYKGQGVYLAESGFQTRPRK